MTTLTLNVINKNEASFQVTDADGRLTWVPYKMVVVVNETAAQPLVGDVGSITFEVNEALAKRLNLVGGNGHKLTPIDKFKNGATSMETEVAPTHQMQLFPNPPPPSLTQWEFTVDPGAARPTVGRYTVVLSADVNDYVTLRIGEWNSRPGVFILSFLKGPDNTTDYLAYAEYNPDKRVYRTWKTFRHAAFMRYVEGARVLLSLDEDGQYGAGEAYAMRSSNCCKCGRDLTVAKSIMRGMGPDCYSKFAPLNELKKMIENNMGGVHQ